MEQQQKQQQRQQPEQMSTSGVQPSVSALAATSAATATPTSHLPNAAASATAPTPVGAIIRPGAAAAAAAAQADTRSLQVRPVQSGRSERLAPFHRLLPSLQPQPPSLSPSLVDTLSDTYRLLASTFLSLPPPPPPQPPAVPAPPPPTDADALAHPQTHSSHPSHAPSTHSHSSSSSSHAHAATAAAAAGKHSHAPISSSHAPLSGDSDNKSLARRSSWSGRSRPFAPLISADTCSSCDALNACDLCQAEAEAAQGGKQAALPSASSPGGGSRSGSASPALPEYDLAARLEMPPVSLEALEAEVQALYRIDPVEEENALQRNRMALRRMSLDQAPDRTLEGAAAAAAAATAAASVIPAGDSGADASMPNACVSVRRPSLVQSDVHVYSWSEIRQHACAESCWLVVRGVVYDVTPMLSTHPAGIQSILRNAGTDATEHYDFHSPAATRLWKKYEIGVLEGYQKQKMCVVQ